MQEALKLMRYLPTKPEAKIWKRNLSKFSECHKNLEGGEGRYLRPQNFYFKKFPKLSNEAQKRN